MKVTFLYDGDSSNINEWSNVPYFLTETFKELGHDINRVNMRIKYIQTIYNLTATLFIKKFLSKNTSYNFARSKLRGFLTDLKLRRVVKKYPDTDLFVSVSDNYNPYKYTSAKCVMICDWTYEFEIVHDLNKNIDKYEDYYHQKQLQMMRNAWSNIIFRDECREYISRNHADFALCNIYEKVINCTSSNIVGGGIPDVKSKSDKIVFIGSQRYTSGARGLYAAADEIRKFNKNAEIYFIGINEEWVLGAGEECKPWCHFCGYLYKGVSKDSKLYYDLLTSAKLCINTNENFASLAGLAEAGYFYNPVIVARHYQTLSFYGANIECGYYCSNGKDEIAYAIRRIFEMPEHEYRALCQKCHDCFKDSTWHSLIQKWIATDFRG